MKRWIKNEDHTCPKCGATTEILVDDTYEYAERCPKGCFNIKYSAMSEEAQPAH